MRSGMNKYSFLSLWTLVLSLVLSSCIKDEDEEITYSNQCYLSSLTLGTVRRALHTTDSEGKDSVYYTTYRGSYFPMVIDQRTHKVENRDSLLFGSQTTMLVTINYVGATIGYRPLSAEDDVEWKTYSTKDSIDFSEPQVFRIWAPTIENYRDYVVTVKVHQEEGDSLNWTQMKEVEPLRTASTLNAFVRGGKLNVLAKMASSIMLAVRSSADEQGEWTTLQTNLPENADIRSLKKSDDLLYVNTTSGAIYSSEDACQWTLVAEEKEGLKLAAATGAFFYAVINDGLYRSTDCMNWETETLDSDADFLPYSQITSCNQVSASGRHYVQLMGYRQDVADTTAVVWSKSWYDGEEEQAEWIYYASSMAEGFGCPRLQDISLFTYDGRSVVIGGASEPGCGSHQALDNMYISKDYGIHWKPDVYMPLPHELCGVEAPISCTVDEANYIWIVAGQQLWRGRLNRLGFARP